MKTSGKYHQNIWNYMIKSNPSLLKLIESYIDTYNKSATAEKSKDLLNRLKSNKQDQYMAACFELYIFILFKKLDFEVEIEPKLDNRKPDFLLTDTATKEQIYVEATTVGKGDIDSKRRIAINCVQDRISHQVKSDKYSIGLRFPGTCRENDVSNKVIAEIKEWIKDPSSPYEREFKNESDNQSQKKSNNWVLTLYPISEPREDVIGPSLEGPQVYLQSDTEKRIQRVLKDKTKYKDLKQPYIIAINTAPFVCSDYNNLLKNTLLGTEVTQGTDRKQNGFFHAKSSSCVSGILAFFNWNPYSWVNDLCVMFPSQFYTNPSPTVAYPVNSKFLNKLYDVAGIKKEDWIKASNKP